MLLINVLADIDYQIRTEIDRIKFQLLLNASLKEGSLSKQDKMSLEASVKRGYQFVLGYPDKIGAKAKRHILVIMQLMLLSNVPCSHRHYLTVVEIIGRLLSGDVMKEVRDSCLMQLSELREFSTVLIEETLNDVRT